RACAVVCIIVVSSGAELTLVPRMPLRRAARIGRSPRIWDRGGLDFPVLVLRAARQALSRACRRVSNGFLGVRRGCAADGPRWWDLLAAARAWWLSACGPGWFSGFAVRRERR